MTNPPDAKYPVADARDLLKRVRIKMDVWVECGTHFARDFFERAGHGRWKMLMEHANSKKSRVDISFSIPKVVREGVSLVKDKRGLVLRTEEKSG